LKPRVSWLRWSVLALVLCVLASGFVFVGRHWPYSQGTLLPVFEHVFKAKVTAQGFRRLYFPGPGCEFDVLTLAGGANGATGKPLAVVQRMRMRGSYSDLIFRPHHLADIELEGLTVTVPPPSVRKQVFNHEVGNPSFEEVTIGSVTADNSVLVIEDEDSKEPLEFKIHRLRVSSIAAGKPMTYQVRMTIPEPPGELEARGDFGPLQVHALGNTALHGSATLHQARLDKYAGIRGTLDSHEEFGGTLDEVQVTGNATVADFMLMSAKHAIAVRSQFHALVNAREGEVKLEQVSGIVGKSGLHAKGNVAKNAKTGRRETSLDFAIERGRVEDFLWLFNTAAKPPMNGPATASGHIRVTKFGAGFLKNVELNGKFEIHDGHFQKETQAKVNQLSARAQGLKLGKGAEAPDVDVGSLASNVAVEKGTAQFTQLFFELPGARARVQGSYELTSHAVNLQGDLWTNETVSRDTSGIKAILLKPVDPLFRRKHAGAMVGVTMTGDIDNPQFGTYLTKTKKSW
jgi:hypothetical protein